MEEWWNHLGSKAASLMFLWAMYRQFFPVTLRELLAKYLSYYCTLISPYISITFNEFVGDQFNRSEIYSAVQIYLSERTSPKARRLKADTVMDSKNIVLSIDDNEKVEDEFNGVTLWWHSSKTVTQRQGFFYPASDERRSVRLTFHKRDREVVVNNYLSHLLCEGRNIAVRNRSRKLYTNIPGHRSISSVSGWSNVAFEHPATFETLAMDPKKKEEIVKDLLKFGESKEYYWKIGKCWKRGYLLYGPPGTGKSSMIAAMANLLNYDVYDLELTSVKDNTHLRRLLIETRSKSILVIEDIDCSIDLTRQRKKTTKSETGEKIEAENDVVEQNEKDQGKVTLSGLLNFVDGLWSCCRGERIIVFTTNHKERLDQALIRRGRMDKHIELSYCRFDAFKILAKNYLDFESHSLFEEIGGLLDEVEITPADVAEHLMPKSNTEDEESRLRALLQTLILEKKTREGGGHEDAAMPVRAPGKN